MRAIRISLIVVVMLATLPAFATDTNHTDYWEDQLGATCTKYEGHSGFIPVHYDWVIVKGGPGAPLVYEDVSAGTQVTAPINPNTARPFDISWVMKCNARITTTTTTSAPTTTSEPTSSTTSTTVGTTTTTQAVSSSTTTTTPSEPVTSTTAPTTTATTPTELPYTGNLSLLWAAAGLGLLLTGGFLVRRSR